MTRKDYEQVAKVLRNAEASDYLINAFADEFELTNPRFSREYFINSACGEVETV